MLNYRCLVLDHDDTVVRSEETVNYPSFLEALKVLRPGRTITREEFTRWCFSPGFSALCSDYIGLTPEEIDVQYDMWRSYVATHIPPPYDGLRPILTRWKQEGGLLCVSSHSARENILRDYRLYFDLEPDQIFDWDLGEDRRKPSPYALQEIMRLYYLRPDELLWWMISSPAMTWPTPAACRSPARAGRTTTPRSALFCAASAIFISRPCRSSSRCCLVLDKYDIIENNRKAG